MGQNSREFINCRMSLQIYQDIPPELREEIEVKSIDDSLPEYKNDEILKGYWKQSYKLKDNIKKRQYEIKNQINKNGNNEQI